MKQSGKILDDRIERKMDKAITWICVRREEDQKMQKLGEACWETTRFLTNTVKG